MKAFVHNSRCFGIDSNINIIFKHWMPEFYIRFILLWTESQVESGVFSYASSYARRILDSIMVNIIRAHQLYLTKKISAMRFIAGIILITLNHRYLRNNLSVKMLSHLVNHVSATILHFVFHNLRLLLNIQIVVGPNPSFPDQGAENR